MECRLLLGNREGSERGVFGADGLWVSTPFRRSRMEADPFKVGLRRSALSVPFGRRGRFSQSRKNKRPLGKWPANLPAICKAVRHAPTTTIPQLWGCGLSTGGGELRPMQAVALCRGWEGSS